MKIFSAQAIAFSYGEKLIFDSTTIEAKPYEITGLLGANGAGKTTFFDLVCGLQSLSQGKIYNNFEQLLYLSQTVMTSPALRMSDIFRMIAALTSSRPASFEHTMEKLGAWAPGIIDRYKYIWNKKSSICSYGEKRWFFTLTLLSLDADFIILDEPTAGVDPEFRYYIWQCLTQAAAEGAAILISSHNVEEITQYCDCFYLITQKKFKKFDSAQAFMSCYQANTLDEAFIVSAASSSI